MQRAIEALVYEWARVIDENRLEDLAGLLTEDGEYKVASRYNLDRGLPLAVIDTRSRGQSATVSRRSGWRTSTRRTATGTSSPACR